MLITIIILLIKVLHLEGINYLDILLTYLYYFLVKNFLTIQSYILLLNPLYLLQIFFYIINSINYINPKYFHFLIIYSFLLFYFDKLFLRTLFFLYSAEERCWTNGFAIGTFHGFRRHTKRSRSRRRWNG